MPGWPRPRRTPPRCGTSRRAATTSPALSGLRLRSDLTTVLDSGLPRCFGAGPVEDGRQHAGSGVEIGRSTPVTHYHLLATLDELGPASQADLGRAAGIDRSDVAAAMLELEAGGHIHREPGHGRRVVVSLTADGIRRLTELGAVIEHVQSAVLAPLTPSEQQMLIELLVKIQPREPDPASSDQP